MRECAHAQRRAALNLCFCPLLCVRAGVIASPQDFIAMLELMVGCRFEIPNKLDLSDDCKDLLRRMLLPEPHKRITTEEILEHPWFNTNLPPEAATMNDRCLMLAPMPGVPDAETIRQIVHAACSNTLYAGSSEHMSGSNKGSSRDSSDTRAGNPASGGPHGAQHMQQMHAGMQTQYGHMQQQMLQPQQLTPQQLQAHQLQAHQLQAQQQHHMQMMWQQQQQAQQQAAAAGVYVQQHELQQQAQQQQGLQPPFYHI
jgi:serine/threonine protein kinase